MDTIADLIARALAAPDDDGALATVRAEVEALCRTFPLYPEVVAARHADGDALRAAVEAALAPGGPLAAALPDFEARPGQLEMAAAVAQRFAEGGVLLAEAGTGTGKTLAYLVPGDPQPPARAGLDRHQEPAGTDLLQGPAGPARRARPSRSRRRT